MSRWESVQSRTWRRFLVLCVCVIALPQAGGAVVTEEPRLAAPTIPQEHPPDYVPKQCLIKFTPTVSACAHCLIAQGRPFADLTGSGQLDELNRRFGVRAARPLFLERHGQSAQQAQGKWQQQVAAVKARFPQRTRRAPDPDGAFADLTNVYLFEIESEDDVQTICAAYAKTAVVEYCEPNYLVEAALVPNDPFWPTVGSWSQSFDDLWGLKQIQADLAWDITQGTGTIVAVTDTGFDFTHPDRGATWTNPDEIAGNGLDDDGNGLVDDVQGWDFVSGDNDPTDNNGHGTHVTGIINAALNNATGIVGVAPASTAMILKTQGATGSGTLTALAQAINYASAEGADVINMSLATSPIATPLTLRDAIDLAHDTFGVILVASAGNDFHADVGTEERGIFPAAFNDVITVAANLNAIWQTIEVMNFSNIGAKIDVAAPGSGNNDDPLTAFDSFRAVLSLKATGATSSFTASGQLLVPPPSGAGSYVRQAGTSQAAPFVAGTAALIVSQQPSLTNEQVRQVLRNSAVDIERPDRDRTSGYGRLNAYQALQLGSIPIARLSNPPLFSKVKQGTALDVRGTATSPTAGFDSWRVLVKRLDELTFTQIASGTTPLTDGLFTTWDTSGLTIGEQYVVRLEVQDVNGKTAWDHSVVYCRTPVERFTFQQLTSTPSPRNNLQPSLNADGSKVAFYSTADLVPGSNPGGFQVFLLDTATSQFQQVTFGSGGSLQIGLSISADGSRVAFMSNQDLVGLNAPPNQNREVFFFDQALPPPGIRQLTQTTAPFPFATPKPDLSADGQWVAFEMDADLVGHNPDLDFEIFRADTGTGAIEQLTESASQVWNQWPSLNSDGTQVAFQSDLFGNNADILLLDVESGLLQRILNPAPGEAGQPSIMTSVNLDGSRIAFVSTAELVPPQNADRNQEAFFVDVNTELITQITRSQHIAGGFINIESWLPEISGDGNRITFVSNAHQDPSIGNLFRSGVEFDNGVQIFLYDIPTNRLYQVTDVLGQFKTLKTEWSSLNLDGTRIVFQSPGELDPNPGPAADNPDRNVELFLATTVDRPPLLDPIGPKTIAAGQPLAFTVSGSDPDVDPLIFSASNLPTGASFTPATRTFSWTPSGAQVRAEPYYVRFVIDDGTFGDMEDVPMTVTTNDPPVLDPIGNKTVNESQLLQFSVSASDPNASQTLTLSATSLPSGASFPTVQGTSPLSGTFSWTPSVTQAGTYQVTFTVSDGQLTDDETILMTVSETNQPPVLASIGSRTFEEGQLLIFWPSATDADNDLLTLSASILPPGASFPTAQGTGSVTGTFSWRPGYDQAGSYQVTFTASDGQLADAETITLTVQDTATAQVRVFGTVTRQQRDPNTGSVLTSPVEGATVKVRQTGSSSILCTRTTGSDGRYDCLVPRAIWYDVEAQHATYGLAVTRLYVPTTQNEVQGNLTYFGCFIATAAYGSPLAPEVDILRAYRDQLLSRSPLGRSLTEFYYRTSPPIARFIADKPLLRALVREVLRPVIRWAKRQLGAARQ